MAVGSRRVALPGSRRLGSCRSREGRVGVLLGGKAGGEARALAKEESPSFSGGATERSSSAASSQMGRGNDDKGVVVEGEDVWEGECGGTGRMVGREGWEVTRRKRQENRLKHNSAPEPQRSDDGGGWRGRVPGQRDLLAELTRCRQNGRHDFARLAWEAADKSTLTVQHYNRYAEILGEVHDTNGLKALYSNMVQLSEAGALHVDARTYTTFMKGFGFCQETKLVWESFEKAIAGGEEPSPDCLGVAGRAFCACSSFSSLTQILERCIENGWTFNGVLAGSFFSCRSNMQMWIDLHTFLCEAANVKDAENYCAPIALPLQGLDYGQCTIGDASEQTRFTLDSSSSNCELGLKFLNIIDLLHQLGMEETQMDQLCGRAVSAMHSIKFYDGVPVVHNTCLRWGAPYEIRTTTMVMYSHVKMRMASEAVRTYNQAIEEVVPDIAMLYTLLIAQKACDDWEGMLKTFFKMEAQDKPSARSHNMALLAATKVQKWDLCLRILASMKGRNMPTTVGENIVREGAEQHGQEALLEKFKSNSPNANEEGGGERRTSTDIYSYGVMIHRAHAKDVDRILRDMKEDGFVPNRTINNSLINVYGRAKEVKKAEDIFQRLLDSQEEPADLISYTSMLKAYAKCGNYEAVDRLWEDMTRGNNGIEPNVIAYTTLIHEYSKADRCWQAIALYEELKDKNIVPNNVTYGAVIKACGGARNYRLALEVYDEMKKKNIKVGIIIYQNLIWTMAQCHKWDKCKELFACSKSEGVRPDRIMFNTLMYAAGKFGELDETKAIFREMRETTVLTDAACKAMLHSHARHGKVDEALSLLEKYSAAGLLRKSQKVYNTMLNACMKGPGGRNSGHPDGALKIFRIMNDSNDPELKPGVISFNMVMKGFVRGGQPEMALEFFSQMDRRGIRPDHDTAVTLMECLGDLGRPEDAAGVISAMRKQGMEPSRPMYSVLMRVYKRSGMFERCFQLFEEMKHAHIPNKYDFYSVLFAAAAMHDDDKITRYISEMAGRMIECDGATYHQIIRGYIEGDDLNAAAEYWQRMKNLRVEPCRQTWAHVREALRRLGRQEEAEEVDRTMQECGFPDPFRRHPKILKKKPQEGQLERKEVLE